MHRAQTVILAFALAAALATVVSAALAYRGLRPAFEQEFAARLAQVAELGSSHVAPGDAAEVRRLGVDSGVFWGLQGQFDYLRSVMALSNLALVDSSRSTIYDVQLADRGLLTHSSYDSLAPAALTRALAGMPASAAFRRDGNEARAEIGRAHV